MRELVTSPKTVRDVDWIQRCWPAQRKEGGNYPKVTK
ncbi:unnamed protein product, partial [Choristocarpus tenellus]